MNELRVALKGFDKARVDHVDFAFVVEVGGPIRQNKRKTEIRQKPPIEVRSMQRRTWRSGRENCAEESRWDTRARRRSGSYGLLEMRSYQRQRSKGGCDLSSLNDWEAIAKTESAGTV
jgi:hypothetical protein